MPIQGTVAGRKGRSESEGGSEVVEERKTCLVAREYGEKEDEIAREERRMREMMMSVQKSRRRDTTAK